MSIAAWAYEKDSDFLTDLIDTFKGSGHCEKEWEKELAKKEPDKKVADRVKKRKKFW